MLLDHSVLLLNRGKGKEADGLIQKQQTRESGVGLAVFETCGKGTQHCTVLTAYHFTLQTPVNTRVNQQQGVNGTQKPYLTKCNNHG